MKLVYLEQGAYSCSTTWESADYVFADIGTGVRVLKSRKLRPGSLLTFDDAVEHIAAVADELARTGSKVSGRVAVLITGLRPAAQSTPAPEQVFVALRHTGTAGTIYEVLVDKYGITPPYALTAKELLPYLATLANGLQKPSGFVKAPAKAAAETAAKGKPLSETPTGRISLHCIKNRAPSDFVFELPHLSDFESLLRRATEANLPGPTFIDYVDLVPSCGFAAAAREMKAKAAKDVKKGEMMYEKDTTDKIIETAERLQELIMQAEEDEIKADEAVFSRVRAARAKIATAKREAEAAKAANDKLLVETFRPVGDVLARLVDCPITERYSGHRYGATCKVFDTAADFDGFRIQAVLTGFPGKAHLRLARANGKFDIIKADDAINMIIRNAVELGIKLPGE